MCFFFLLFTLLQSHKLVGEENLKFKKERQAYNKELDNTFLEVKIKIKILVIINEINKRSISSVIIYQLLMFNSLLSFFLYLLQFRLE